MVSRTVDYWATQDESPLNAAPPVGNIQKSLVLTGYFFIAVAAVIYAHFSDRHFLGDAAVDGYTYQVQYIWNYFDGGNSILDLEPLLWVHSLRALIAYIFVWLEDLGGPAITAAALLLLTAPIVFAFSAMRRGYLVFALPLIEAFVSERTFLVIIAVAYLVMFIRGGRGVFYLTISFLLANLSSGSVLNNLIISTTVGRSLRPKSISLYIYIVGMFLSFIVSAADKYAGFSEQRSGYDATVYGASGIEAILSRSTIYVSFVDGNYSRIIVYLTIAIVALFLMFFAIRNRDYRGYVVIMLSVIPSLIFEGLGFVSLLVPILLFLAGERLPWRLRDAERSGD